MITNEQKMKLFLELFNNQTNIEVPSISNKKETVKEQHRRIYLDNQERNKLQALRWVKKNLQK